MPDGHYDMHVDVDCRRIYAFARHSFVTCYYYINSSYHIRSHHLISVSRVFFIKLKNDVFCVIASVGVRMVCLECVRYKHPRAGKFQIVHSQIKRLHVQTSQNTTTADNNLIRDWHNLIRKYVPLYVCSILVRTFNASSTY